MYKTILVNSDVEDGRRVLDGLEKHGVPIQAAFWYHFDEEDQWKLVAVSPDVSEKGPIHVYTTVSMLLYDLANDPQKPLQFPFDRIMVISPNTLLYKTVKQQSGPKTGPVREGLALDAYIYKME